MLAAGRLLARARPSPQTASPAVRSGLPRGLEGANLETSITTTAVLNRVNPLSAALSISTGVSASPWREPIRNIAAALSLDIITAALADETLSFFTFNAGDYISEGATGAANAAGLASLFTAVRANATKASIVFPAGEFALQGSISPAGAAGADPNIHMMFFCGTQFNISGTTADYVEIVRSSGNTLASYNGNVTDSCIPNDGFLLTGAGYTGVRKWCVFDCEGLENVYMGGKLTINRTGTRITDLWAIGNRGTTSMLKRAYIQHLTVNNLEGGIYALHLSSSQVDPITNLHIGYYDFDGRCAVAVDANSDAWRLDHYRFNFDSDYGVYIHLCYAVSWGAGFMNAGNGSPVRMLQMSSTQLTIDTMYVHQVSASVGTTHSAIAVYEKSRLNIRHYHQDRLNGYSCGAGIFIGRNLKNQACKMSHVTIGSVAHSMLNETDTAAEHRNVIAIDCSSNMADKYRVIRFDIFDQTLNWTAIKPIQPGGGWASSSTDHYMVCDTAGLHHYRADTSGTLVTF